MQLLLQEISPRSIGFYMFLILLYFDCVFMSTLAIFFSGNLAFSVYSASELRWIWTKPVTFRRWVASSVLLIFSRTSNTTRQHFPSSWFSQVRDLILYFRIFLSLWIIGGVVLFDKRKIRWSWLLFVWWLVCSSSLYCLVYEWLGCKIFVQGAQER